MLQVPLHILKKLSIRIEVFVIFIKKRSQRRIEVVLWHYHSFRFYNNTGIGFLFLNWNTGLPGRCVDWFGFWITATGSQQNKEEENSTVFHMPPKYSANVIKTRT